MGFSVGLTLPGLAVSAGTSMSGTAGGTAGTTSAAGTSGTSAVTGTSAPVLAPEVPVLPTSATSKAVWAIQVGETILVNRRLSTGPSAWVPYRAIYVFGDGNACLVREPDCVTYTGPLLVDLNLRRAGETYGDT